MDDYPTPQTVPPSGTEEHPSKKSAEARIDELISEIKGEREEKVRMQQEIEDLKQRVPPPPPPVPGQMSVEEQRAIEALKKLKFVTQEDLESKVRAIEERYALNSEHQRFEQEFDGSDGRPKYDRNAVEKFMRDRALYDPLVAYKMLHESELLDWTLKEEDKKKNPDVYMETPGSRGTRQDDDTALAEKLREHQKNPTESSKAWYEENRPKILDMLAKGEL